MASLRAGSVFNYDDHAIGEFAAGGTESGWDTYNTYTYVDFDSFNINGAVIETDAVESTVVEDTRVFPRVPRERVLP
jgi:hypothetical protein